MTREFFRAKTSYPMEPAKRWGHAQYPTLKVHEAKPKIKYIRIGASLHRIMWHYCKSCQIFFYHSEVV